MKKWLFLVFFLLVLGLLVFFWAQRQFTQPTYENLMYNQVTGEWETNFTPPSTILDETSQTGDQDGFHNLAVQRGYFDSYDPATGTIQMKALLPFTQGTKFRLIKLQTSPSQVVYCVPRDFTDPKTKQVYQTQDLNFPVKSNDILTIPSERLITLDDFLAHSQTSTYLFVQLNESLKEQGDNFIKKLIVVGLCNS